MNKNINIGIVGQGFVGSAIREGLNSFYEINTYDLRPELSNCESLGDLIHKSEHYFYVPTHPYE